MRWWRRRRCYCEEVPVVSRCRARSPLKLTRFFLAISGPLFPSLSSPLLASLGRATADCAGCGCCRRCAESRSKDFGTVATYGRLREVWVVLFLYQLALSKTTRRRSVMRWQKGTGLVTSGWKLGSESLRGRRAVRACVAVAVVAVAAGLTLARRRAARPRVQLYEHSGTPTRGAAATHFDRALAAVSEQSLWEWCRGASIRSGPVRSGYIPNGGE